MPFWPFLMASAAGLALWGLPRDAWHIPAIVLCGYVAARAIVTLVPSNFIEVVLCASWLFFCVLMLIRGGEIPAFFFALSALTYPVLLLLGMRIQYMGVVPIVSDGLSILALLSIGGGLFGMAPSDSGPDRPNNWLANHSLGLARH